MSVKDPEDRALDVLLKEYDRLCVEIRTLEGKNENLLGFGITVLGVAVTVGLKEKIPEIFIILPLILVMLVQYYLYKFRTIFLYGGYKMSVERRINEFLRTKELFWEDIASNRIMLSFGSVSGFVSVVALGVAVVAYSIYRVSLDYTPTVASLVGIVTGVSCLSAMAVFLEARTTFHRTYEASRRIREFAQGAQKPEGKQEVLEVQQPEPT